MTDATSALRAHGYAQSSPGLWLTPDGLRLMSEADALQAINYSEPNDAEAADTAKAKR